MKAYENLARRAEQAADEYYRKKNRQNDTLQISAKDGLLNRILACVSWLNRLPGTPQKKATYTKRIWDAYLSVQESDVDDKVTIPEVLNSSRNLYLTDIPETSIADSGIGTGGTGYSSVVYKDMGTQITGKTVNPYWKPRKRSKARTLEGKEKDDAYRQYLTNLRG